MWRARCMSTNVTAALGGAGAAVARRGRQADPLTASLKELTFRELAFAADTLARTRVKDRNLWSRLCDRLKPELKSVDLAHVLRVVHALAKVDYKKIALMNSVERIVLQRHAALEPRAVTQYFIDACRLEHCEPNTFQAVMLSRLGELGRFSAFDLCFLLHVAAKLRLPDRVILDAVSDEICGYPEKYEHLCKDKVLVAMVIRSLALLQHRNGLFDKLVYSRLPGCIYTFGPQEMCNVLFSLVVAFQNEKYGEELTDIVTVLLDRVAKHLKELVYIEVNQLCISLYHLRYKLEPFDPRYQAMLDDIVRLNLEFAPSTSKMQYKISRLLDDLKVRHKAEQRVGPYVMDYVLPQLQVAIEVNGYSHFYHQSTEFNAITRLKYQIVESLGWKMVSVNYFEWKNRSRQVGPAWGAIRCSEQAAVLGRAAAGATARVVTCAVAPGPGRRRRTPRRGSGAALLSTVKRSVGKLTFVVYHVECRYFPLSAFLRQSAREHASGFAARGIHPNKGLVAVLLNCPVAADGDVVAEQVRDCLVGSVAVRAGRY
ncbi:RAP protein, putative [Babesia caballi]|uniref:RAP protein, putative n=1 Tax=Babesia caballi TaxID=5871 RepID=A0AAV4LZL1_BABCB|nr:RAP protein, putative [Babesia caballi]